VEPVRVEKTVKLKSSPADIWPQASNTDRINRALGLPETEASAPGPRDMRKTVRSRLLGLPVTWLEAPFEYVEGRYYVLARDFVDGPLLRYELTLTLAADGAGSTAVLRGVFAPRWELARPLLRLAASKTLGDIARLIAEIDDSLARAGTCPAPPRTVTPVDETSFRARSRILLEGRAAKAAAERLLAHLRESPDDEVRGMRPFELADRWGVPRPDALCAFLHAVKAGLLDLSWDVLCPNCAAPKESLSNLSGLKTTSHCGSCEIEYGVDLASSVELRFSAQPSVRDAKSAVFCVGSPAHTRHACAQLLLDGAAARAVDLDLEARSFVVRSLKTKRTVTLRPSAAGPSTVSIDFARAADGDEIAFRPGPVRAVFQPTLEPALVRVEKESWKDAAASAALVTTMQDFRDLFSAEVLARGVEIGVKNLALLFTDLKGSTAMYERVGDAAAYGVVRDHFDWLTAIIAARGGAVVKTIGDAVMAVFPSGAGALEAALDMQERIGELAARLAPREPVVLKIGVHQGPTIAINAGGLLDYFGTMVNVAARVQNESAGGDVVVTKAIEADPACRAVMDRRCPAAERVTIALKGLRGEFELKRLTIRAPK
jgi:class 3 adenylate cyclase